MKEVYFEQYLAEDYTLQVEEADSASGEILRGVLFAKANSREPIPIIQGIPRFVDGSNYASSFGFQWNRFRTTQLDSVSGLPLSTKRFWRHTKWQPEELAGKKVLEVGSGAGRFTEILLDAGAKLVSFDYSAAVEANFRNNSNKGDLFLFQGDLYDLPLKQQSFDFVFCYGVLQHTPDPSEAYRSIFKMLAPGGRLSLDYYLKTDKATPWTTPKYAWRPITVKMNPQTLYKTIRLYVPLFLPFDTLVRKIPKIGRTLLAHMRIPCWNYLGQGLSWKQRREWAILDTFDALATAYDQPKTPEEVRQMVDSPENKSLEVFLGSNGVVANIQRVDSKL